MIAARLISGNEGAVIAESANETTAEISHRAVIEECAVGLAVLHVGGELRDANRAFCELTGYRRAELLQSGFGMADLLSRDATENYRQHLAALTRGDEESYRQPQQIVRKDGAVVWVELTINLMRATDGAPHGLVVTAVDITEQRHAENAFRAMSFHDPLTRLPNRRLLRDRLEIAVARALRDERYVALLFIDLDNFKSVNDSWGHAAGDGLLKAVARRLLSCLRDYDTAARLGGDELVVLLPDLAEREAAAHIADRIREALATPFLTEEGQRLEISASIGAALYPEHAGSARDLLRASDAAMYEAKKLGGNRVVYSSPANAPSPAPQAVSEATSGLIRLTWEAGFASGNAFIDAEHRELFRHSNRLLDLCMRTELPQADVHAAWLELVRTVEGHFRHEERILAQSGYPALEAHAARHRRLKERAEELLRQPVEPSTMVSEILKFTVAEMIHGHVVSEDRDFFPWIQAGSAAGHGG